MQAVTNFNNFSQKIDHFMTPAGKWLDEHETVNKVVMVVNHVLRTLPMAAAMYLLPLSPLANCAICFAGSFFYRLTVERCCDFRFAIHSAIGGAAFMASLTSLKAIVTKVAFKSLINFGKAFGGLAPIALYGLWTLFIAHASVEARKSKTQSCCGPTKMWSAPSNFGTTPSKSILKKGVSFKVNSSNSTDAAMQTLSAEQLKEDLGDDEQE